jgi:hypothetical protein
MALTDKLTAIADAIRAKTGKTDALTLAQMPGEIEGIQTGSAPDGTSVTFGNVKKIVVTPAPDNKAYYNGVLLPRIPEDVLAECPYAWIRNDTQNGKYDLILSTVPFYVESASVITTGGPNSKMYRIAISAAETATEWAYNQDTTAGFGYDSSRTVLWSNHDIPNGSATATDIYFAGSEPVTEIESSTLVPVEREETYAIASESLNALGAVTQKMAGKKALMTVADMVYWLNRVQYVPQGNAENTSSVSQISSAVGIVPTVYRGTAISTQSVFNFSNAVGSIVESA